MPRKIDGVPRALTRTTRTTRLVFDMDAAGNVVSISAQRVMDTTDDSQAIVRTETAGGVTLPVSAIPPSLPALLRQVDKAVDTEEGLRPSPPPDV